MTIVESKPILSRLYDRVCKIKSANVKNYFTVMLRNHKVFIGAFILALLGLPCIVISVLCEVNDPQNYSRTIMFLSIGIASFIAYLALGFVFPRTAFDFLTNRNKVDTRLALPLNQRQQFFSNYFAAITLYIVPYIISALIALVIWSFLKTIPTLDVDNYTHYSEYPNTGVMALGLFGFMMVLIMFITIQVFVLTFTGSQFEEKVFTLVTMGVVPIVAAVYGVSLFVGGSEAVYGVPFSEVYLALVTSNPVGGGIYNAGYIFESNSVFGFGNWFVGFFIWILIYLGLSYFYFMKRKAEHTGNPIVFMSVYNVLIFCMLFITFLPTTNEEFSDWGAGVAFFVISIILYAIIETIRNRGFHNIVKSFIRYGVCAVLALSISAITISTNSFGIDKYVPSKLAVSSVYINFYGLFDEFPTMYNADMTFYETYGSIEFKEKENVQLILNLHKRIAENQPKYDVNNNDYTLRDFHYLGIVYKLKSGLIVSRDYQIPRDYVLPLIPLLSSDEYAEFTKTAIDEGFGLNYRIPDKNDVFNHFSITSKLEFQSKEIKVANVKEFSDKLKDAYSKDLKAMTVEDYMKSGALCEMHLPGSGTLTVLNSFTNTIALLDEYNYEPNTDKEQLSSLMSENNYSEYDGYEVYYDEDGTAYYNGEGNVYTEIDERDVQRITGLTMNMYKIDKNPLSEIAISTSFYKQESDNGEKKVAVVPVTKWLEYIEKANKHIVLTNSDNLDEYYKIRFHNQVFIIKASDVNLDELLQSDENSYSGSLIDDSVLPPGVVTDIDDSVLPPGVVTDIDDLPPGVVTDIDGSTNSRVAYSPNYDGGDSSNSSNSNNSNNNSDSSNSYSDSRSSSSQSAA
jgi:ABC-2 type transport system permease protein